MGGVVKTLRRSNFTILAIVVVFLVRKGPLGVAKDLQDCRQAIMGQIRERLLTDID